MTQRNVSPDVSAAARAAQGLPQSGAVAGGNASIDQLLAALGGSGGNKGLLLQLIALLAGGGSTVPGMQAPGAASPIEQAYMGGGDNG